MALFRGQEMVHYMEERSARITILRSLLKAHPIRDSIVCSTKHKNETVLEFLNSKTNCTWLDHVTEVPIDNRYATPETLGKDRLAGVIGAKALFPNDACLLIDAGTCMTIDYVSARGIYRGGSISPGIQMRFKALHTFTDKLPLEKIHDSFPVEGRTTAEAIRSGVLHAILFEIEGYINYYKKDSARLKVIITGGDTPFFEKQLKTQIFAHPKIVLIGLNKILEHKHLSRH